MKKVKLELSLKQVETILYALNDDMGNFYEDCGYYKDLLDLELKIRKELQNVYSTIKRRHTI